MIYHKTLEKVNKVIFRNYIIVVKKAIDQLKKDSRSVKFTMKFDALNVLPQNFWKKLVKLTLT